MSLPKLKKPIKKDENKKEGKEIIPKNQMGFWGNFFVLMVVFMFFSSAYSFFVEKNNKVETIPLSQAFVRL
jgi:hypothetical protein